MVIKILKNWILSMMSLTTQREFSLKFIEVLNDFFVDDRANEFSVFLWSNQPNSTTIHLKTVFTWKIMQEGEIIYNSNAYSLFKSKKFLKPLMGFSYDTELSEYIESVLSPVNFDINEFPALFRITTGVSFFHLNWQEGARAIFGSDNFKEFYATRLANKLHETMQEKCFFEKIVKI